MTATTTNSRKWLIGGLILSLGLNLFLGGFLVTHMIRPDPFSIFPKIPLHQLIRELPEETREKAIAIMHDRHPLLHRQFEAIKAAQDRLQQSIKADHIDREALNTAFNDLRRARADLEQTLQGSFVEIILMLPPETRKNLALHWYQPPHRFGHMGAGDAPPGPPPVQP
jgi:hypothetical protein